VDLRFFARLANLLFLVLCQRDFCSAKVLIQTLRVGSTGDGEEIITLGHDPGQRELRRRTTLPLCNLGNGIHELQVLWEVLLAESRRHASKVTLFEIVRAAHSPGQHTPAQRRVAHDRYAEFATGVQQPDFGVLNVQRERRVLDLHGLDGVDLVRATQALARTLGQTQVLDLALVLELLHGLDRLLDGGFAVQTVCIVQVYGVEAETSQGGRAGLFAVFGRRVDAAVPLGVDFVGEFGREEDFLALVGVLLEPAACVFLLSVSRSLALSLLAF